MSWIFTGPMPDEVELHERARSLLVGRLPGLMDRGELAAATATHGADVATAMALQAIHSAPDQAAYLARLAAVPVSTKPLDGTPPALVVVPSMYYRERPELGGDGALIRDIAVRLGLRASIAALDSLGTLSSNAEMLIHRLEQLDEPAWFASISKGGADLKRALCLRPDLSERIAGWIAIANMPGGTPMAEAQPGRPISHALLEGWLRLRGGSPGMLREMGSTHPFSLAAMTKPVFVINVVAMPMSFHLRQPVDRSAAYLAKFGPNDGYVLLADALLPGPVVPLYGADHYCRVPEFTPLIYRLLRLHLGSQP